MAGMKFTRKQQALIVWHLRATCEFETTLQKKAQTAYNRACPFKTDKMEQEKADAIKHYENAVALHTIADNAAKSDKDTLAMLAEYSKLLPRNDVSFNTKALIADIEAGKIKINELRLGGGLPA